MLWLLGAACTIILFLYPAAGWAGPNQVFEEYGVGPRDKAMGNAFTGLADDYSAAFYNPAGYAFGDGHHFHFGYHGMYPNTYIKFDPDNGYNLGKGPSTDLFLFGFSSDLDFSSLLNPWISEHFGLGMALGVGKYFKSFTLYTDPNAPYMFRYSDRPVSLLSLYAGFGLKMFEWFSVGASMVAAPSETYTDVIARTKIYVPSMKSETKQGMGTRAWSKLEPSAGVLFRLPFFERIDTLQIGLSWRDEVITFDGSGEVTTVTQIVFEESGQTLNVPMTTMELHQLTGYSPMCATLGVAWKPTPEIAVVVDGVWKKWSDWLDGDENIPHPRFKDTYQVRTGYEQRFDIEWAFVEEVAARGGYYYEPSPAPDMNGPMNILDPDKHVTSVGTGFTFHDPIYLVLSPISFDMAYQVHWLVRQHLENDDDPVYPPLTAGGQVHTFAATLEFQL